MTWILYIINSLNLHSNYMKCSYHLHFTDEATEVLKGEITCSRLFNPQPGFESGKPDSRVHNHNLTLPITEQNPSLHLHSHQHVYSLFYSDLSFPSTLANTDRAKKLYLMENNSIEEESRMSKRTKMLPAQLLGPFLNFSWNMLCIFRSS